MYAALAAAKLGHRAAAVTAAEACDALEALFRGVALRCHPSSVTTTFENRYIGAKRNQYVHAVARPLSHEDVPLAWFDAPVIHLGPVAHEIPPSLIQAFSTHALIGVTPQGWLRTWDTEGRVHPTQWHDARQVLEHADVLIYSEHDVEGDPFGQDRYARMASVAVLTHGAQGATVYWDHGAHLCSLPAFATNESEPTGAGDVFAAAFLLHFHQSRDPVASARYANCAASFAVEGPGATTLATAQQVAERLRRQTQVM